MLMQVVEANTDPVWVTLFGTIQFILPPPAKQTALPIRFETQKATLLLAYLLAHPGKYISREYLASIFWPESDAALARRSLRGALNFIRMGLKELGLDPSHIQATQATVCLVPHAFVTDVAEFERALRLAAIQSAITNEARITYLEKAIGLYHGPFLHGYNDTAEAEGWIATARQRYADLFEDSLMQVAILHQTRGDLTQALHYARLATQTPDNPARTLLAATLSEQMVQAAKFSVPLPETPSPTLATAVVPELSKPEALVGRALAENTLSPLPVAPIPRQVISRKTILGGIVGVSFVGGLGFWATRYRPSVQPPKAAGAATKVGDKEAPKPRKSDPGLLDAPNAYTSPDAQGMQEIDYEAALGHYHRLLSVTRQPRERFAIAINLQRLGSSAHLLDIGKGSIALSALETALAVFRETRNRSEIAHTLLTLANVNLLQGQRPRAVVALTEVTQITPTLPTTLNRASCYLCVGEVSLDLGEYRTAQQSLERARQIYTRSQVPEYQNGLTFSLRFLGEHASETGDYETAHRCLTGAARRLLATGEIETRAAVLGLIGTLYLRLGNWAPARSHYQEGLAVWEKQGQKYYTALFKAHLARVEFYHGRECEAMGDRNGASVFYTEARRLTQESLGIFAESSGPVGRALPLYVRGQINLRERRYTECAHDLEESLVLRQKVGNPGKIAEVLEAKAAFTYQVTSGSLNTAIALLQKADALRKKAGTPLPPCDHAAIATLRHHLGLPVA